MQFGYCAEFAVPKKENNKIEVEEVASKVIKKQPQKPLPLCKAVVPLKNLEPQRC